MFDFLKKVVKKIWSVLRKVIVVAAICLAIYFTLGFSFAAYPLLTGWFPGLLCAGLAFLVDPETAGAVFASVGEALGQAAAAIADIAGEVVSGAVSGSRAFGLVAAAALAFFFLTRERGKEEPAEPELEPAEPELDLVGPMEPT